MKREDITKAQLVMIVGFMAIGFFFKLKGKEEVFDVILNGVFGLGLIFLIIPSLGDLVVKGWFKLAQGLGWINSRILLSAIFFLVLFPISLIRRIGSKDTLMLKKKERTTAYTERNHTYTARDMKYGW